MLNLQKRPDQQGNIFPLLILSVAAGLLITAVLFNFSATSKIFNDNKKVLYSSEINVIGKPKELTSRELKIEKYSLAGQDALSITFDLKGVCLLDGIASQINIFDEEGLSYSTSLGEYAENCKNGVQTAVIPLTDFFGNDKVKSISNVTLTFWQPTQFALNLKELSIGNENVLGKKTKKKKTKKSKVKTTPTPVLTPTLVATPTESTTYPVPTSIPTAAITPTQTPTPTTSNTTSWEIKSVSSMKETKDKVCGQTYYVPLAILGPMAVPPVVAPEVDG
jgi:hypothetical protein